MHTWGRVQNTDGSYSWVRVETEDNGSNDLVYLTSLLQEIKLQKGESPFFADRGIGAKDSVMSQLWPDYDVVLIQQRYSSYFASLVITKTAGTPDGGSIDPTYQVSVITNYGTSITAKIPV